MTMSSSKCCNCGIDMEERVRKERPVESNSFITRYNTPLNYILFIVCMCTHKHDIPQLTSGRQESNLHESFLFSLCSSHGSNSGHWAQQQVP